MVRVLDTEGRLGTQMPPFTATQTDLFWLKSVTEPLISEEIYLTTL